MENIEKKTALECLQEEIRIFRKNEEATYDMLALYELLLQDTNIHNLVGITLTEKVIHDLEDPEITISYKGNNIYNPIKSLDDKFYEILRKYKDIEECKEYCDCFDTSYKEMLASRDFSSLFYQRDSYNFNLMKQLLCKSPQFVYKFLVSDIPFDTRLDVFAYAMGSYKLPTFIHFLQGPSKDYLSKEDYQKASSKIREIIEAFNRGECRICKVQNLVNHLVEDDQYGLINQLHGYGVDFNQCYWNYTSKNIPIINSRLISTVGVLFDRTRTLSSITDFYEADSYLNVDKTVRKNNDLLILDQISSRELCDFIKLSHFEVTEEKIRFLASLLVEDIEDYSINQLDSIKEEFNQNNQKIADAIIRKAKNKEEYKKLQKQAVLFMDLVDIDKLMAKRKEEKERHEKEEQQLKQKRQEFSTLLYNMNEYAQENIPPRTLVKNIKFGE